MSRVRFVPLALIRRAVRDHSMGVVLVRPLLRVARMMLNEPPALSVRRVQHVIDSRVFSPRARARSTRLPRRDRVPGVLR